MFVDDNEVVTILNTQENAQSRNESPEGPARFSLAILALINAAIFAVLIYSIYSGLVAQS